MAITIPETEPLEFYLGATGKALIKKSKIECSQRLESLKVGANFMVKVKITRDCSIEGKHYGVGDVAEVIEKDRDLLLAIEKAVAYDGKPEPKMVKKGKK